jgi:hypothetical protein
MEQTNGSAVPDANDASQAVSLTKRIGESSRQPF